MSDNPLPGNPAAAEALADLIGQIGEGLETTANALGRIDPGAYKGQAADAFRANYLDSAPGNWRNAADSMNAASDALRIYAEVLAQQQQVAAHAAASLTEAQQATHTPPGGTPPPNPTTAQAINDMERSRQAVQDAGHTAAQKVRGAYATAPALSNHFWDDRLDAVVGGAKGVADGVVKGLEDLGKTGKLVDDHFDPAQRLLHPEQIQAEDTKIAAAMTQLGAQYDLHPLQTLGSIGAQAIDLKTMQRNPEEWIGKLIPNIALGAAGGAVGAAAKGAGTGAQVAGDIEKVDGVAARALEEAPEKPPVEPDSGQPGDVGHGEEKPWNPGDPNDPPPSERGEMDHHMDPAGDPPPAPDPNGRPELESSPAGPGNWDPPAHVQAQDIQRGIDRIDDRIDSIQGQLDLRRRLGGNHIDPDQLAQWRQENMQMNQQLQKLGEQKARLSRQLDQIRGAS